MKNYSDSGGFYLTAEGNGFINIEPNTEFTINNPTSMPFYNWGNLQLKSGQINISGTGKSYFILIGKFSGLLNVIIDGNIPLELWSKKFDWNGETIRFKGYTVQGSASPSRYGYIQTDGIQGNLDIESCTGVNMYGNFANNTKIRIDGSSSLGYVHLYGNYSDTVSIHMNCSDGAILYSYNDKIEDLTYNANNAGKLAINAKVNLGKNIIINNNSKRKITINTGINIGDNVIININKNYPSNINITEDIPAGATVNY